jgi:hypothetical protein
VQDECARLDALEDLSPLVQLLRGPA